MHRLPGSPKDHTCRILLSSSRWLQTLKASKGTGPLLLLVLRSHTTVRAKRNQVTLVRVCKLVTYKAYIAHKHVLFECTYFRNQEILHKS